MKKVDRHIKGHPMTCQHNYMLSPVDPSRRFCCICGEQEEHLESDAMEIKTTGRITYADWDSGTLGITIYKQDGSEDDRMPRVFLTVPESDMAAFVAARYVSVSITPDPTDHRPA